MASLDSKGEIVPRELPNPEETLLRKGENRVGGGELGSLIVLTILDIVTSRKREARNFEKFSKMAQLPFPNATFKVGFPRY